MTFCGGEGCGVHGAEGLDYIIKGCMPKMKIMHNQLPQYMHNYTEKHSWELGFINSL